MIQKGARSDVMGAVQNRQQRGGVSDATKFYVQDFIQHAMSYSPMFWGLVGVPFL